MTTLRPLLLAATAALLLLTACGRKAPSDDPTPAEVAAAAKAAGTANGLCPVLHRLVEPEDMTEYKGQKIGFCCPPCAPQFRKDPEHYMEPMRKDPARFGYTAP